MGAPTLIRMDIDGYVEHLTGLGRAHKTIRTYVTALERLAAACGPLEELTAVELRAYADTTPNGYSTRRHLRTAIKTYYEWLGRPGPHRAVRVPRKPRYRCKAFSEADTRLLVKTAMGWYPQGLAVLFGVYLALRASEIAAAETRRFEDDFTWYRVLGKGDVTATLPVHPVLAQEVQAAGSDGWVFPGHRGREHVTPQTIWNWTREVADAAGIEDRMWPHRLRHTALATANDNLGDLRAVSEFARHADVSETVRYTRTTQQTLRKVSSALDYV